jgi:hypothetical protein
VKGQYGHALKHVAEIIERGVQEHPELSIGSNADGIEVHSVGNSQILKASMLIEAFNLKAAIEFQLKNVEAAQVSVQTADISIPAGTLSRVCNRRLSQICHRVLRTSLMR